MLQLAINSRYKIPGSCRSDEERIGHRRAWNAVSLQPVTYVPPPPPARPVPMLSIVSVWLPAASLHAAESSRPAGRYLCRDSEPARWCEVSDGRPSADGGQNLERAAGQCWRPSTDRRMTVGASFPTRVRLTAFVIWRRLRIFLIEDWAVHGCREVTRHAWWRGNFQQMQSRYPNVTAERKYTTIIIGAYAQKRPLLVRSQTTSRHCDLTLRKSPNTRATVGMIVFLAATKHKWT